MLPEIYIIEKRFIFSLIKLETCIKQKIHSDTVTLSQIQVSIVNIHSRFI